MKKIFSFLIICIIVEISFSSCNLFGLDLQEPAEFNSEEGLSDPNLKQSGWNWILSRSDIFSQLIDAVRYSEMDSTLYDQANTTLIMPTNSALVTGTNSYWNRCSPKPINWRDLPKEQVRNMLAYHIIKGSYSTNDVYTLLGIGAPAFFHTMASDIYGVNGAFILLSFENEKGGCVYFNNYPTHYASQLRARTTNLITNTRSYVHVIDNCLAYPTPDDLSLYKEIK